MENTSRCGTEREKKASKFTFAGRAIGTDTGTNMDKILSPLFCKVISPEENCSRSRHHMWPQGESTFSGKTGYWFKLSGCFYFRTHALLFTAALGSAPYSRSPSPFQTGNALRYNDDDIIWSFGLIV